MIHTGKFHHAEIYHNTKGETPEAVKAKTGCTTIVNGMLFNPDGTFCLKARVNGLTLANESGAFYGYGWSGNSLPVISHSDNMNSFDNYITSIHISPTIKRGRTAVSFYDGKYTILCTSDSNGALTIPEVETAMKKYNSQFLILDGGGSSYLDCPRGKVDATMQRKTANKMYLLIWEDVEPQKEDDTKVTKRIAIDAGHGMNTYGKRCLKSIDPNETREWFLNNRIACYVEKLLEEYDCETMRLDDVTGKTDVPLATRVNKANSANADMLASIHANAGIGGEDGGGICVFAAVNGSETSDKLQKAVYKYTVAETGLKGNRYDGVPDTNFYMIYKSNMPAFLGEFGFMDSTVDTPIILTDDFARKCAKGIVQGIVEVMGIQKKSETSTTAQPSGSIYRVIVPQTQVGAFTDKLKADNLVKEYTIKGLKPYITTEVKA